MGIKYICDGEDCGRELGPLEYRHVDQESIGALKIYCWACQNKRESSEAIKFPRLKDLVEGWKELKPNGGSHD